MNQVEYIAEEKFSFVHRDERIMDVDIKTKPIGYFKDAAIRLGKNKTSMISLCIICITIILSIFAPMMSGYGFNDQYPEKANMPPKAPVLEKLGIMDGTSVLVKRRADTLTDKNKYPNNCIIKVQNEQTVSGVKMVDVVVDYYKYVGVDSSEYHLMGTDYLGRDLWTRLWRGSRISLLIALISVLANTFIGIIYGAVAGYYGGTVDMVMMRIIEIIGAFPDIVVATLFVMLFGTGMTSIILALVVRGWIPVSRIVRAQFYRFKGREYVLAARTLGVKDSALIFRHILPNSMGPVITRMMVSIPGAIFMESFLAYIGLGIKAPEPSIGVLLSNAQKLLLLYPYQTLFPALLISVLMIGFNLLSNGVRDALNPTLRGQE